MARHSPNVAQHGMNSVKVYLKGTVIQGVRNRLRKLAKGS